ncbi:MAG: glycosyltransferase [Bacteroidales bacterium]|nr:glycosyltransferase [Bacteroidales bacterium]
MTNDIFTDRRVCRIARSLADHGHKVTVIGRKYKQNTKLPDFSFRMYRMRLLFSRGLLFYAEYNFRLLFRLLLMHTDILVANDLDTLPAVYLASRIRKRTVIYDSHEYFTEVPELIGRNLVKNIWQLLERMILPKIRYAYTVSESIAKAYQQKYGINMYVIRNLPWRLKKSVDPEKMIKKDNEQMILYQGSLNRGRGLELAILATGYLHDTKLVIIGTGDVEHELKSLAEIHGLQNKVLFLGRIPQDQLMQYTIQADAGISLEEQSGLNYTYALPNKLFDYIQAGIPVIVSDLPEMASIVIRYEIGVVSKARDPEALAGIFREALWNPEKRRIWKDNLMKAAKELCWEREEPKLIELYRNAANKISDDPEQPDQ